MFFRRWWHPALTALAAGGLAVGALGSAHDRRLQAFVLLALLFALWRVGRTLADMLVPALPPLSAVVAAFTFAAAFGSVAATLLGHFGVLRPAPFLLVVAAALLATLLRNDGSTESRPSDAVALDDGGEPGSRGQGVTSLSAGPRARALTDRIETVAAIATGAAMALGYLGEVVRRFALPLHGGPDDLSYHLSAIAVWQRWGDLRMLKFSMGDWGTAFYPILPEISGWALLAPFRDSDVAARWTELPYALAALVAVAAIARRLGLGARSAMLAAALYGVLHRVAALAFAAGNDHVTAFCTLAALDAALACAERPRLGRFAYLGTALGLLVASKYLGIYNAVTVLAVFAVAWVVRSREAPVPGERRRPLAGAAVLLATLALAGGYTYLRNWVTTGNPVYPQPVRVAAAELFRGREEMSLGTRRGDDQEIDPSEVWEILAGPDNDLAGFLPFTLLPAALLAPLLGAARRRWLDALVLALPAAFFLQFLFLTWDHRSSRYFFAGVALAAVAFAWLTEQLGTAGAWLRTATLAVVLYRFVRWLGIRGEWELAIAALLVAGAAFGWEASSRWKTRPRWRAAARSASKPLLAASLAAATLALGCGVERYQSVKLTGSPAALALERLVGERGAAVGYVGLNQPYLFFGNRLQNDVRIVPRSWNLRAEFYRWGGRLERPLPPTNRYRRWLGVIETLGVRYVVVVRSAHENPERRWMANHWERFRRVHVDEQLEIWRLLPAGRARSGGT